MTANNARFAKFIAWPVFASREAVAGFTHCIVAIDPPASASTQPHGNGAIQPFGNGPTQPLRKQNPKPADDGSV